ncbi:hypothetical protein Q5P01_020866 [Channa striata]|uniref:Ig-like domain-containing protein n=1 Tax=Channa striata TaxID=64152 RepID=A0AA88LYI2_CHASR|nr:hypothetical protein Q5P01_020866 [Channa striata]
METCDQSSDTPNFSSSYQLHKIESFQQIMALIILRQHLLVCSIHLLWTTGLIAGKDVTQTDMIWEKEGKDATINCSHTMGAGYYQMYWYRLKPGETMTQMVFVYENKEPEYGADFKKEKYPVTKPDAHSGTLTLKSLVPGDKGVYFCAVSEHSDSDALHS